MKNKLKLLLLSMMFIGLGLSFCSSNYDFVYTDSTNYSSGRSELYTIPQGHSYIDFVFPSNSISCFTLNGSHASCTFSNNNLLVGGSFYCYLNFESEPSYATGIHCNNLYDTTDRILFTYSNFLESTICDPSTINVLYNNENSSETIICNGDNVIQIDGLSTITATNKFTPYFNIDYRDENNQLLTESYSNDILYLSGSLFKKTFTGNNDRILTTHNSNSESIFTGFVPVFDVTGSTATIDTGNMFNNFSDNALKVLLSNIPGYIQYITIFFILLFLFGFIRRFKSKR